MIRSTIRTVLNRSHSLNGAANQVQAWCRADFQNSNWWWSWIGTPRAVAKALLLLPAAAAVELLPGCDSIMIRSNFSHPGNPNEATNLVWMAGTRALVGSLTGNASEITEAFGRLESTAAIDAFGEGLQPDGSYWQHGPQLYSGWGYGAIWTGQMLFFGNMAAGTRWEFSADVVAGLGKMIVDGQRWMTAGPNFDYSTCGRLLSYFANATGVGGLNHGHYHYFAAFVPWSQAFPRFQSATLTPALLTPLAVLWTGLLNTSWATTTLPNASLIASFVSQLKHGGIEGAVGHRHYWRSDYSVLRRPASTHAAVGAGLRPNAKSAPATVSRNGYMVSVRMASTRTIPSECGNEENKQGQDLSDGVTNVYTTGREFEDIYPVWQWRRLPGTIEVQTPVVPPGTGAAACDQFISDMRARHRTEFVGGASDGSVGITVMDFRSRGELAVRRTWFMLDGVVVISNTGSTTLPTESPVTTSLDQRLVAGSATYATRTAAPPFVAAPMHIDAGVRNALTTSNLAWLHHSDIGYVPLPTPLMARRKGSGSLPGYTVRASLLNLTGSWENITQGDANPITKPVFSAYIDHGMATRPVNVSSTYAIVPGVPTAAMPAALALLDAKLSVQPGWGASSTCYLGGGTGEATTPMMMAALWQTNASARVAAAGCWDITLVSLASPPPTVVANANMAAVCPGATQPVKGAHCDLEHSTALSAVPSTNVTDCAAKCCAAFECSCWTWTPDEGGKGPFCMLKASRAPLVPAAGLFGGTIPSRAPPEPALATRGVVAILSGGGGPSSRSRGLRLHVADPSALLASATLEISGRWTGGCCTPSPYESGKNASRVVVALPAGQLAGSTVEIHCAPA